MPGAPQLPWQAERAVDPARAAELIAAAFPHLAGRPVSPLAEGWDHTVHRVDGRWAFRFPRRAIALPGFHRELALLPRIAPHLPLPIPVPELVAEDDDPADPWPFAGFRLLPGQELAAVDLPDEARAGFAAPVGRFLRVLHSGARRAMLDDAPRLTLPVDPLARGWPRARLTDTRRMLAVLLERGAWAGDPAVDALLAAAAALGPPTGEPVLVHGDLHVRHLLVDPGSAGTVTGVIDWGDACRADPAVDLAIAYTAFAGPARGALLAAYGAVPADRELRARALAVRLSAALAWHATITQLPRLQREALAGLRRAVD